MKLLYKPNGADSVKSVGQWLVSLAISGHGDSGCHGTKIKTGRCVEEGSRIPCAAVASVVTRSAVICRIAPRKCLLLRGYNSTKP